MDETNCCKNCKFFWADSPDEGACHRYPPSIILPGRDGTRVDDWRRPTVYADVGWCGEFQLDLAALAENIRTMEEEGGAQ